MARQNITRTHSVSMTQPEEAKKRGGT